MFKVFLSFFNYFVGFMHFHFLPISIQSCLKVYGEGKLLYMFLFPVDGRYTKNQTVPPFFNPFFTFSFSHSYPLFRKKGIEKWENSLILSIPSVNLK